MIRRGSVKRNNPHVVFLRVANEHGGSDAHFGEIFTAPRLRLSFLGRVKLIENLVESALHHAFGQFHELGERYEDAPTVGILETLLHNQFWEN